uniref:Uncharacterized protein n=1 Tax=Anguilla anguilla TaxID=7936 RepID=A0A0E9U727_ANGAN
MRGRVSDWTQSGVAVIHIPLYCICFHSSASLGMTKDLVCVQHCIRCSSSHSLCSFSFWLLTL